MKKFILKFLQTFGVNQYIYICEYTDILTSFFNRARTNQNGSFTIIFAFSAALLIGSVGSALDYARGYLLKAELTSALDAAALAVGTNASSANTAAIMQKYFKVNFPDNYLGATVSALNLNVNAAGGLVTASVSAELDYTLLSLFLDTKMSVSASTEVTLEKRGMEIALVMDNTGSMNGTKMTTMKSSAQELVDILYGDKQVVDKMWIGLVPYVATVNIGKNNSSWLTSLNQSNYSPSTWKGCIEARGTAEMSDNTPAVGGKWAPYFWADNSDNDWQCTLSKGKCSLAVTTSCGNTSNIYSGQNATTKWFINENQCAANNGTGPNLGCPSPITPLTQSRTTVTNAISAMEAWHRGGTFSNIGLSWGWRVISPKWKGLWAGVAAAQPFDYTEPLMEKVAIILTDGQNGFYDNPPAGPNGSDYTAYQRSSVNTIGNYTPTASICKSIAGSDSTAAINKQFCQTCEDMKAQGILIYTITFEVGTSNIRDIYRNCATTPAYYFDSPTTAELSGIFKTIGDSLSNLRISK